MDKRQLYPSLSVCLWPYRPHNWLTRCIFVLIPSHHRIKPIPQQSMVILPVKPLFCIPANMYIWMTCPCPGASCVSAPESTTLNSSIYWTYLRLIWRRSDQVVAPAQHVELTTIKHHIFHSNAFYDYYNDDYDQRPRATTLLFGTCVYICHYSRI